jgi:hypothetical protein
MERSAIEDADHEVERCVTSEQLDEPEEYEEPCMIMLMTISIHEIFQMLK